MGNKKKIGTRYKTYNTKKNKTKGERPLLAGSSSSPSLQTPKPRPSPNQPSSSKVKLQDNLSYYELMKDTWQYDIFSTERFEKLLDEIAVCKFCHCSLKLSKKSLVGLVSEFKVSCTNCNAEKYSANCELVNSENLSTKPSNLYDLNVRLVLNVRP